MRHFKPPLSRTLRLATIMLFTTSLLLTGLAFAQDGQIDQQITKGHKTSKPGVITLTPAQSGYDINQEITGTMRVEKPDSEGYIFRLDQLWAQPYVAPAEIDPDSVHEVLYPSWLGKTPSIERPDGAKQTLSGPLVSGSAGLNFDALGNGISGPNGTFAVNSVPPDTNHAVGTTQVVETVNSGFGIFSKSTGVMTAGPYNLTALWSVLPAGSPCTGSDGNSLHSVSISDPVVVHDQFAQRWLITVLALPYVTSSGALAPPYYHCVAVSATDDATGSWSVFEYNPGASVSGQTSDLPDYPKMNVWRDSYTFTYDMFNSAGSAYVSAEVCGIDRNALLAGSSATIICFDTPNTSSDFALLPSYADGAIYPPLQTSGTAGTDTCTGASPCQPQTLLMENNGLANTETTVFYYRVHYNFTTPAHSAVSTRGSINVASYTQNICTNTQQCVPQPPAVSPPSGSTAAKLDTLAFHFMHRLPYRNFGTFESVIANESVREGGTGTPSDIRWYEFRGINSTTGTGTPSVQQQSTFIPDTTLWRWMGSMAADHNNNMLLGYSTANATSPNFPSLAITGRLVGDGTNSLETEQQVWAGSNSQVLLSGYTAPAGSRWGDYSAMQLDPDDCTFWYSQEYLKTAGDFNWNTRLVQWNFPTANCSDAASITLPIPNAQGGSALTSGTANFYWTPGSGGPTGYTLSVGSTQGGSNYFTHTYSASTYTATVTTLPVDGSTFWVRLTTTGGTGAGFQDYQYTAPLLAQATTTTVSSTANPSTYGQSVSFTATVTAGGNPVTSGTVQFVVDGSNFGTAVALNGAGQATSLPTSTLTATTHSVQANYSGSGSYLASNGSLNQTVNKAVLTVTATNASDTYGGPLPSLTYTITGFVNGDGPGVVSGSPNESTTATTSSNVGPYPINISQGSLTATNYTFTFVNGTFTVNAALLTVTANSTAITYGCACSPVLTYIITGFVLGQTQGTATTGQPAEGTAGTQAGPAGMYPINITQGTLAANNNNYTFTFVNGVLTVNQATLTVTADNKTATEGDGLPTFTASYSGFVNGDNQGVLSGSPSFSTDAPNGPPVGTWTIFVTQGSLAATNYTFTFVNGTLTVNPAVAQLTAPLKNTMLSGSSVNFTWSHETNAVEYQLLLGSTPGGSDLASVTTANLTTTVNGLPTDGSYIYATLEGSTDGTNYTVQDSGLYVAYGPIAVMINPLPDTMFAGPSVTFNWVAGASSSAYWIDVGSTPGGNDYYQSGNLGSALTATVNGLPTDGSNVYVTLWSLVGGNWQNNEYTYTAYNNASNKGVMQTPPPSSTLTGSTVTFTWSAGTGSTAYWLDIGNVAGGNQYYQSGNLGNVLSTTASNLPTDGSTVYVTLYSLVGGQWLSNAYTYTAYSASSGTGTLTTPAPGSTFTGSTVTFGWTAGTGSSAYWLDAGSTPGGNQYYQSGNLGNVLTTTANGMPTDGSTVYVTLYSLVGGQWVANGYTYTAFNASTGAAVMQTPTPGSTLSGNVQTFTWSPGTGATAYWMDIGSTIGGNDIYQSGNLGNVLTTTVYSLPANGSQIYVTLYSLIGGQWFSNSYMYTSNP